MFEDDQTQMEGGDGMPTEATRKAARDAYGWQQLRRRDDGHFDLPVRGFGGGLYTLWLPSPRIQTRHVFINGEPVREVLQSCFKDPATRELRENVVCSFASDRGVFEIDMAFMKYASAVLQLNYRLSDEDLTMLLDGQTWHARMIDHLIGGEDMIDLMSKIRMPRRVSALKSPIATPSVIPTAVPKPQSIFSRLFRGGR